ncbi:MAG: YqhT [uncultured bacterium]|nr:MAG: YqhT [uncultured bacterium]OGJ47372.1 MAG: hypothetical protein A2244_02685 [Candidatus Peregrinibacteria bacterium RIFOXYA2_FULL_41_18]OGJ47751.1 MAG: hypothetical protein A2344_05655 [Candidatus Peregrinibacteria bacterium RIFOXYB12_FULL_41_12]OGJ52530.1 MAG: hypothetical protein A2448_00020 [Candidatus Peregrinibacteria bacterium RIFOXYC2_FULL_41_22]
MQNLLITSPTNIRYLSGFTGSKAVILQTAKKNYFFTDSRYLEEAKRTIPKTFELELYKKGHFEETWTRLIKKHRITEIEFESSNLTYIALKHWKKIGRPAKLKPQSGAIEQLRAIKTPDEISLLKRSQSINEQVFYSIRKLLKQGVTEKEIAWKIHVVAHDLKADSLSFEPIIAFGKNSAIPHHENDNTRLKKGDIILIDMGVIYKGYCSDMTRTLFTRTPTPFEAEIYNKVLNIQKSVINRLRPEITAHKAFTFASKKIEMIHGLGHGIGLEIHESPSLSEHSKDKLKTGMVVTVEPGIYLNGKFGVRIEDMGVITKNGFQSLTKADKELTILQNM